MIQLPDYGHEYRKDYGEDLSGQWKDRVIIHSDGRSFHIAAKKIQDYEKEGCIPIISFLEKKFLYEKIAFGDEVYLVNKASLLKRLNINKKDYDKANANKQDLIAQKFQELFSEPPQEILPPRKRKNLQESLETASSSIESSSTSKENTEESTTTSGSDTYSSDWSDYITNREMESEIWISSESDSDDWNEVSDVVKEFVEIMKGDYDLATKKEALLAFIEVLPKEEDEGDFDLNFEMFDFTKDEIGKILSKFPKIEKFQCKNPQVLKELIDDKAELNKWGLDKDRVQLLYDENIKDKI